MCIPILGCPGYYKILFSKCPHKHLFDRRVEWTLNAVLLSQSIIALLVRESVVGGTGVSE